MGWSFPWDSSFGSDFNFDFSVGFTEEQQRTRDLVYNYRRPTPAARDQFTGKTTATVPRIMADMTGVDVATYTREGPGMTAFAVEAGVVYHTYSTYSRSLDDLWGMYQRLDRSLRGRNEAGIWFHRHDEYGKQRGSL